MEIRAYDNNDKKEVIKIFHSNCPKYFNTKDESYLIEFLENYADENYLVVVEDKKIIGCGGHYTKEKSHGIAWVMFKSNSLGIKNLLKTSNAFYQEIECRIINEGKFYDVYINTTQLMESFFNRYGFDTYQIINEGFGVGLDEYKMKKQLTTKPKLH